MPKRIIKGSSGDGKLASLADNSIDVFFDDSTFILQQLRDARLAAAQGPTDLPFPRLCFQVLPFEYKLAEPFREFNVSTPDAELSDDCLELKVFGEQVDTARISKLNPGKPTRSIEEQRAARKAMSTSRREKKKKSKEEEANEEGGPAAKRQKTETPNVCASEEERVGMLRTD